MDRPKCIIEGCNNLAMMHHKHKDGSYGYHKLCTSHHRKKFKMCIRGSRGSRGYARQMDHSFCALCGWDKAPCDRHRIKYGTDGGKYIKGNIISVCPNCHRLIHAGLLRIK